MKGEQVLQRLCKRTEVFAKKNGATILTVIGATGVVVTAVYAVKATPKALQMIEKAKEEKGEDLTKLETVKIAGPSYIPAVLFGATTIACIFGANILNKHQQAALMSAYAFLDKSYKKYRNKVEEVYGEDADIRVRSEVAKDNYVDEDIEMEDDKELFYDCYSERYFQSTREDVLKAQYKLNRMMVNGWGAYLNEFYELLGIDTVDYGDYIGWNPYQMNDMYWSCWIDFQHEKVIMDDGLECTLITILQEPTFDFEEY